MATEEPLVVTEIVTEAVVVEAEPAKEENSPAAEPDEPKKEKEIEAKKPAAPRKRNPPTHPSYFEV